MTPTSLPGLPEGYVARRPDPSRDVDAVLAVVVADDEEVLGTAETSREEVAELLDRPLSRPDEDQWLVLDARQPPPRAVAWAAVGRDYPDEDDEIDGYTVPGTPPAVRDALLDALLARAVERARSADARVWSATVLGDARWESPLADRGFTPQRLFARLRRPLDQPLPAPTWPAGTSVRAARPPGDPGHDADLRDFHRVQMTAFRDHWETTDAPYDDWRARIDSEHHRFDRWWIADDAALGPVGICQGVLQYASEGGGWIRNLGVLRQARGRGIARALLLHAMAAFASDGLAWCGLGVDVEGTTGALDLYESVGLAPTFRARVWGRPAVLEAAPGT